MSMFWCPKCGDNLSGPDAETVAANHKKYCHPKIPKAGVIAFDPAFCHDCGEETRYHMNGNQRHLCNTIKSLKSRIDKLEKAEARVKELESHVAMGSALCEGMDRHLVRAEKAEAKLQVAENFIATLWAELCGGEFMCEIPHSTVTIYGKTAQECYENFKKWSENNE